MPSLLLSRLVTMLGLRRVRSSQRMSPPDPSPGSRHARSPRKAGSMTSATTTPTEARLPGLEVEAVEPQMRPNHWLERGNPKRLMVFAGRSHPDLATRIAGVIPWFPYSRQDRKAKPREPISSRLVADMLQLAGADRVLTMDLHAGQIQGFFTIPVDHLTALQLFATHFRDLGLAGDRVVSVAPDAGRAKHAVRFGKMIEASFAIMHKMRPAQEQAETTEVTGRVKGKIAIVGDDASMTGGTLIANVAALREHGARE